MIFQLCAKLAALEGRESFTFPPGSAVRKTVGCSNQNLAIFCSVLTRKGFGVWNIHHYWNLDSQTRVWPFSVQPLQERALEFEIFTTIEIWMFKPGFGHFLFNPYRKGLWSLKYSPLLKSGCSNQGLAIFCLILTGKGFGVWNIHHYWNLDSQTRVWPFSVQPLQERALEFEIFLDNNITFGVHKLYSVMLIDREWFAIHTTSQSPLTSGC